MPRWSQPIRRRNRPGRRSRGFGFHPLWAFVDHGQAGSGEPAAVLLQPGKAGLVRIGGVGVIPTGG
jgi:hypothetical protein